jgi:hypothetical protein
MPRRDHHSVLPADPQSPAEQDWQMLVEQHLPADLEAQARQLKAFQRARGLPSALLLLRGLLYYVLSHSSLRDLSAWSRLIGLTSKVISSQAWHQRLLASADWLLWLFNTLLAAPKRSFRGPSQRILLVDATHVSCRDKRADRWRLRLGLRPAGGPAGLGAHQHAARGRRLCPCAAASRRYPGGRWGLQPHQATAGCCRRPRLRLGALQCSAFAALRTWRSGLDTGSIVWMCQGGCAPCLQVSTNVRLWSWSRRTACLSV